MVDGHALDLVLDLDYRFPARDMLDGLRAVMCEDAGDLMREDAAEADGAAPGVVTVQAAGDTLGAVCETSFVDLWRELAWMNGERSKRRQGGVSDWEYLWVDGRS